MLDDDDDDDIIIFFVKCRPDKPTGDRRRLVLQSLYFY